MSKPSNVTLDFAKDTVVVITGASQGIGQQIAVSVSKKLAGNSTLLLLARNESGLNGTKTKCLAENPRLTVVVRSLDLIAPSNDQLQTALNAALAGRKFENAVIFHNVGTMGNIQNSTLELIDRDEMISFFNLNLFTVTILNSLFTKTVRDLGVKDIYVINITSICGRKPFRYMAQYCSSKATRDIFFKVMAEEDETLNVLSYSPGPIKTDMFKYVTENLGCETDRQYLTKMLVGDNILTAEQTCTKMLGILERGEYKSGDLVDFYDRP